MMKRLYHDLDAAHSFAVLLLQLIARYRMLSAQNCAAAIYANEVTEMIIFHQTLSARCMCFVDPLGYSGAVLLSSRYLRPVILFITSKHCHIDAYWPSCVSF